MNYKKTISYVLILVLLMLSISACSTDNIIKEITENNEVEEIESGPVEGGQIVIPLTNLNTLNPLMTENITYYHFSKLIFEGIFELDNNLNIIPQLAQDYKITNEGRTISIELKKDIKWHDGADFSANDVAFTINTLKYAKDTSSYSNLFQGSQGVFSQGDISIITDVRVIDNYNLDITFDNVSSYNLELLTFPIIPQHTFMDTGNSFAKALELDNYLPIGTGPYKYVNYDKFKSISLTSFDDYRDGKAYITNIEGKVLEDEKLILTAYETGQLSMATTIGVDWDKYKWNKRIRTIEYVSNNYEFIGFNFDSEIFQGENGLAIRKAINYGIDRQAIIRKVYLGHASQIDVPIHPDSWLLSDDANTYGYNLDKAKELLKEVGWSDENEDGVLEDENGEKLSLRILTNSHNQLRLNTAEMISEDLKKIGFEIIKDYEPKFVDSLDEEQINEQWDNINTNLAKGDFEIVVLGWEMSIIPDLSFMFHSSEHQDSSNFINYKNEAMDELLLNAYKAGSIEDKKERYLQLQEHMVEELPYVSLFYKNRALLVDSKIKGDLNPIFLNPYNGLNKCYIPENLQ